MNYPIWKIGPSQAPKNTVIEWLPRSAPDASSPASGPLSGVPFAIKNNICVQDALLTCGSALLRNYRSPYTATAVQWLSSAGAIPVCTANLDEFGMGSTGENSAFGMPENPAAPGYCPGGSSSGSASLVAKGCVPLALCSDTGGSARLPAAYCGVIGMKPTYGAFSRFGLTAYASSLEQIGLIGNDLPLLRAAHACLSEKRDPRDATHRGILARPSPFAPSGAKFALPENALVKADAAVGRACQEAARTLEKLGACAVPCAFLDDRLIAPAYYVIACAEASANLARFTGLLTDPALKNASWEEQFAANRSLLGAETQKRIALGAYVLREGHYDAYYLRAQGYRQRLTAWFSELFAECALMILPVSSCPVPRPRASYKNRLHLYQADWLTACANLAGLPALSLPFGQDASGRPVAVQLIAPAGRDAWLFDAAELLMNERGRNGWKR